MKGVFVQDELTEVWHLLTETDAKTGERVVWGGQRLPKDAPTKPGVLINWADIVHDECARRSEEVD